MLEDRVFGFWIELGGRRAARSRHAQTTITHSGRCGWILSCPDPCASVGGAIGDRVCWRVRGAGEGMSGRSYGPPPRLRGYGARSGVDWRRSGPGEGLEHAGLAQLSTQPAEGDRLGSASTTRASDRAGRPETGSTSQHLRQGQHEPRHGNHATGETVLATRRNPGPSGPGGGQRPSVQADACAGPSARSEPGAQARRISPSSALPGRSSRPLTAGVPAGPGCLQQLRLALLDLRAKCLQVKTLHVARPPWCAGSTVEANEVRLGPHSPRTVQARAPFPARDSTVNGGQVGPPIGWLRQRGQAEDRGQRRIRGSEKVGLALRSGRSGAGRRAK
jgi:hypothetical protein